MILNEDLDWNQVATDPALQRAFRGTPVKTLLPEGRMLCRFITTETSKRISVSIIRRTPGTNTFLSPWWTDWNTTASELTRWKAAKATARDVIRARLAVTIAFSRELDSLVQIILTQRVYAWKGLAQYQDDTVAKVTYLGGAEQYFLPNLACDKEGLSSKVAYMHSFTGIESLV